MECQQPSNNDYKYIIVTVNYFTNWEEFMPTFNNLAKIDAQFLFNHVITNFEILKKLVHDHNTHFQKHVF